MYPPFLANGTCQSSIDGARATSTHCFVRFLTYGCANWSGGRADSRGCRGSLLRRNLWQVSGCIFCRVVAGTAPATKIYEDDILLAFLDIRPITRGHTLVIPKWHASDLDDLNPALGAQLFAFGHRLAKAMRRSELAADGANLLINDGKAAFQTVHHVHLHVVPRRDGDMLTFAKGFVMRRPHDRESTAAAIRAGLDRLAKEEKETSA